MTTTKTAKTRKIAKNSSPKRDRMERMFRYVLQGLTDEQVLAKILKGEPKASTNMQSIQWTRSQLRQGTEYAKKHNPKRIKVLKNSELKASKKSGHKTPAKSKPATSTDKSSPLARAA